MKNNLIFTRMSRSPLYVRAFTDEEYIIYRLILNSLPCKEKDRLLRYPDSYILIDLLKFDEYNNIFM